MFKRTFTAALVMGAAAMAPPAQAQSSCAMRDTVVERLEKFYSEAYQGGGLQNPTSIIEIGSVYETYARFAIAAARQARDEDCGASLMR